MTDELKAQMKAELMKAVEQRLDVPGLVEDAINKAVDPALQEFVESSENPYDDGLKLALMPVLVPLIMKYVKEAWDKVDGEVTVAE